MPILRSLPRISRLFRSSKPYTTAHAQPQIQNSQPQPQYSIRTALNVLSWAARGLLFAHLFMTHAYTISATWGPSMLPTFSVMGDYCLTSKYYRRGRDIKVGDIVVFSSVVKPGETVIKRVLGLEGDYVLRDTPGSARGDMLQVPKGHCWVIGDNLPYSRDSRHFGPMPMGLIKGKVIAKVFPWKERTWFENGLVPVDNDNDPNVSL